MLKRYLLTLFFLSACTNPASIPSAPDVGTPTRDAAAPPKLRFVAWPKNEPDREPLGYTPVLIRTRTRGTGTGTTVLRGNAEAEIGRRPGGRILSDREGALKVEICDTLDNDGDGNVDEFVLNRCGFCGETPRERLTSFHTRNHGEDGVDEDCDGKIDEHFLGATCEADGDCARPLSCINGRCATSCDSCAECDELVASLTVRDPVSGELVADWTDNDAEMMLSWESFDICRECLFSCGGLGGICIEGLCYREPHRVGNCRTHMEETKTSFTRVWVEADFDENESLLNVQRLTRLEDYCAY